MSVVVPVLVEGWQHECCGDSFALGSSVSWRLRLRPGAWWEPVALPVTLEPLPGTVRRQWVGPGDDAGPSPVVARSGGLVVFVPDDAQALGGVLRGGLQEDRHVDVPTGVDPTPAVVERIRLVTRTFRTARRGELVALAGSAELADLSAAPRMLPEVTAAADPLLVRQATGFLVDLRVDPA